MKRLASVSMILLLGLAGIGASAQQQQKVVPLNPPAAAPAATLQTLGTVGDTNYAWTNGNAWRGMDDNAKVALVVGIEQGLILGVRENWDVVPAADRATLKKTAERVTVGGVPFNEVVTKIDEVYLDTDNSRIPVVDAYMYVVLELKKTSKDDLKGYLKLLQKTYPEPKPPKEKKH